MGYTHNLHMGYPWAIHGLPRVPVNDPWVTNPTAFLVLPMGSPWVLTMDHPWAGYLWVTHSQPLEHFDVLPVGYPVARGDPGAFHF